MAYIQNLLSYKESIETQKIQVQNFYQLYIGELLKKQSRLIVAINNIIGGLNGRQITSFIQLIDFNVFY